MALPVSHTISLYQGDTYSLIFKLSTKDAEGVITPVDLTGAEVQANILEKKSRDLIVALTTEITDAEEGEVTLSLTAAQTAEIDDKGIWDCQVIFPDGTVRTYIKGSMSVAMQVTE